MLRRKSPEWREVPDNYFPNETWMFLPKEDLYVLYKNMIKWCQFYSWVYYDNNGVVAGVNPVSDYEFDMMTYRIDWIEERFPDLKERANKKGGSISDYVDLQISTLGKNTYVPIFPPKINLK